MFGKIFKKNILIIGGNGNLGKALRKNNFFKKSYFPTKKELNILNQNQLKLYLDFFQLVLLNSQNQVNWLPVLH